MAISRQIIKIIEKNFPGLKPIEIQPFTKTGINLIVASHGEFILKEHDFSMSHNIDKLESIYRSSVNANLMPEYLLSKTNKYIVQDSGNCYSIQKKINTANSQINPSLLGKKVAALHAVLNKQKITIKNHLSDAVKDIMFSAKYYGYSNLLPFLKKVFEFSDKYDVQIIHGDLHQNNILVSKNEYYFIDFDSATIFYPLSDVAFSAFRIFGQSMDKIHSYIKAYNLYSGCHKITLEEIWNSLIYTILQRILFIKIEADKGNDKWMKDLINQKRYLSTILNSKNLFISR